MKSFKINRLNTPWGVFKVSGFYDYHESIKITKLEIMGTDGWVLFNENFNFNQELILEVKNFLVRTG
ncbi:hypothetical protein S40542_08590 [Pseudoalteromonas luteoviolacea]|uniref:Uncharacterized protein n=2 Tax=Pseudoalteromonas luteoviolacea TaxID=43657 RepID=A0A0F6AIM9_9GAMM|nr:hypothetical protein S40542_08590 [Pseudoalteromonas luteoviolacea]AOT17724.1 hypothetical protein S4054_08585 [Pseudoalteromonas luteoviolacea]KKE85866.1 hypothetical protein N479_00400 [Pseudoalteromonas luteoviolacea S4054]KZN74744.1 hypothetical protein N481_08780 [Pseudoalteromonas luteoviolacea S4047-1]